jgi:hypothetical protein
MPADLNVPLSESDIAPPQTSSCQQGKQSMGQRLSSTQSFAAIFHHEMVQARRLDGPLHAHVLQRGPQTVVIFGEVHTASSCGDGATLPQLLRNVLRRCQVKVHLFVEDHVDYEEEPRTGEPTSTEALDVIRSTAAQIQRHPVPNVHVHYTDSRSRLCIANHAHMVRLVATLLPLRRQHPRQIHQALIQIIDEFIRRPLLSMITTKGPQLFSKYQRHMASSDRQIYDALLQALKVRMDGVDRRVSRAQVGDNWLDMIEQYSQIANRLNDLYTLAKMIRPSVTVSIVYLGANHAAFLTRLLRRTMGFRLLRRYGRLDVDKADGCLHTQQKI